MKPHQFEACFQGEFCNCCHHQEEAEFGEGVTRCGAPRRHPLHEKPKK